MIRGGGAQLAGLSELGSISHGVGDWSRDCDPSAQGHQVLGGGRVGLKSV